MHACETGTASTVSIVIPAYNAAATLAEALRSVLAQTLPPMEIIVVNDGSTDDTAEVLRQFGDKVKTLHQENSGLAATRRAGIAAARGDLIALFDADDLCEPDRLAVQVAFMDACPEVLLTATDFSAFNEQGQVIKSFAQSYYGAFKRYPHGINDIFPIHDELELAQGMSAATRVTTYRGPVYEKLVLGNFIHPPTVMFRRTVLDLAGNFDPEAGVMCDWDWLMQVARKGQIGLIARDLLRYRISPNQRSAERFRYRRSVGNIHILNRIRDRDPEIYQRYLGEFEGKRGMYCQDAADSICEVRRIEALKWLARSMLRHGRVNKQCLLILVKMMMPSGLRGMVRNRRVAQA
jgi:glycosyltransferase involved in cell wall biosynthesis